MTFGLCDKIRDWYHLMEFDPNALKNTFARFITGVTVVSCQPAGEGVKPVAMTVNSFTSVSLNPPLVLWCIDRKSSIFDAFHSSDNYAVTILRGDQPRLSERFASPDSHDFDGLETDIMLTGAPLLRDRLAGLDCKIEARHDAGDHLILLGRVVDFDYRDDRPLMYIGRNYSEGPVITEEKG